MLLGEWLDFMILEVFSNLWFYDSTQNFAGGQDGSKILNNHDLMFKNIKNKQNKTKRRFCKNKTGRTSQHVLLAVLKDSLPNQSFA